MIDKNDINTNQEKNQFIREKTGAQNIVKEIKQYQKKWPQHVQKMDTNRIPRQALQYKSKGRRNVGRPRKRWRDHFVTVYIPFHLALIGTFYIFITKCR